MSHCIAILGGTGRMGSGLAMRWASADETVIIGSRDRDRAQEAADQIRSRLNRSVSLSGSDYVGAVGEADIVVMTVPFTVQLKTLKTVREQLKDGTILMDTTVPLAANIGGSATQTVAPWQGSAAQQMAAHAPDGVCVVAAFHTIAAGRLAAWPDEVDGDVLVTGDDTEAKSTVGTLIEKIPNLRAIDAGPLEMARITEQLTALLISIDIKYKAGGAGIRLTRIDSKPGVLT